MAHKIAVIQRFLPSRSRGGVGHFTHSLCNGLASRGHDVTVISQDPAPSDARYRVTMLPGGARLGGYDLEPLAFPWRVARVDFRGFDIIHAQGDEQFISRGVSAPVVRTMHGSSLREAMHNGLLGGSPKHLLLHGYFYVGEFIAQCRADAVVVVSKDTARFYPRVRACIPACVDVARFQPNGEQKSLCPSVLFVGDLHSRKRGDLLRQVFLERVRRDFRDAELWLVCKEPTNGDGVRWLGSVSTETLPSLYRQAWVFCLPSSYEGFGLPYVEAMAAGTPAVATRNPGAREVLGNGRYGVIVEDGELGDALCRLLGNPDLRRQYADRGLRRAAHFGEERVAARYERIYESLLAARREYRGRRNILYVQSTSEIGGSDVSLSRIVERLDKRRFRAHVVVPGDGPLLPQLKASGARVVIVPQMAKMTTRGGLGYLVRYVTTFPVAILKMVRIIRRQRIDVVHTNTIHNLHGFVAAALSRRRHVWHVREIVVRPKIVRTIELFLARRFADRIVVTSDAIGAMFTANGAGPIPNLRKVSNGVDVERYHPLNDGSTVRAGLGVAKDAPLVGLVSRLDHWKGVETFIRAAAICRRACPEARYVMVGGPVIGREDYAAKMESLAASLALGDVLQFTGWRYAPEDMPRVHAALSVLVVASSWPEPFGLVILEAMASGKPVVSTNHGGPVELCVDGKTAILVPPNDPERMSSAVETLVRHPEMARAFGEAGRDRVVALYDQRLCVRALEGIYDELTGQAVCAE